MTKYLALGALLSSSLIGASATDVQKKPAPSILYSNISCWKAIGGFCTGLGLGLGYHFWKFKK